ncbi:serine hydroxymethyltransferase [Candidatus Woesebacteria bacterium RIFOXYA1_FULL_40_18]|uniref:Serine hydroxymethyltransferase n=1 Tax=Candidatus Woesebacteria bacterium RIFOXYA1_FULL_40_18 TaxID=1802532 RepID=A0A1F8CL95_9BACT|nr:MAG: serine hydroxymethyltransferase [Candidatus Woesebacteria bacterium RIFOXYA1_FULL_40_18]
MWGLASDILLPMDKIFSLIKAEEKRQRETLMMIPSENYSSKEVRKASGSVLAHKYSEGYPGRRYYQGNKFIDEIENLAIERAKKLFGVPHVNVQPYSGSPANAAVYMGLLEPKDTIMGLALASGGHLTHGHPKITFSGKYFNSVQYGVDKNGFIDYKDLARLARKHKPKLIVAGTTAYPRILDWKRFAKIADSVGAILMADIAHISGLVVAGAHPSPVPYAHVVTTTTHKTLRGPRGALIMVTKKGLRRDPDMAKKIDRAVFPGLQGGPHNHQTAAIAVCLNEATSAAFKNYGRKVVENAKVLASELMRSGFDLVSGGSDNHLMLVDLRSKNVLGKPTAELLEEAGIIVNYNAIPNDPNPPMNPSGLRIGTPALTSRGMGVSEMKKIAGWINEVVGNPKSAKKVKEEVKKLCKRFPVL